MDKKSLLELAEKYMSVGIVNWEMPNESRKKDVRVYINLLELKAFCIPDKDENDMLLKIREMLKSQKTDTDEQIIKGNNSQAGYFIRAGTIGMGGNVDSVIVKDPDTEKITALAPLRNVKVELWHRDSMGPNNYLKTTYADNNGNYSFTYDEFCGVFLVNTIST